MAKKMTATQESAKLKAAGYTFRTRGYTVGSGPHALEQATLQIFAPDGTLIAEGPPWVLRKRALAHMAASETK